MPSLLEFSAIIMVKCIDFCAHQATYLHCGAGYLLHCGACVCVSVRVCECARARARVCVCVALLYTHVHVVPFCAKRRL